MKMPAVIEYTPVYFRILLYLSLNINNNEPNDEKVMKTIKKINNDRASLNNEVELLKILYPYLKTIF